MTFANIFNLIKCIMIFKHNKITLIGKEIVANFICQVKIDVNKLSTKPDSFAANLSNISHSTIFKNILKNYTTSRTLTR